MPLILLLVFVYMLHNASPIIRVISWVGYIICLSIAIAYMWHLGIFEIYWYYMDLLLGIPFLFLSLFASVFFGS